MRAERRTSGRFDSDSKANQYSAEVVLEWYELYSILYKVRADNQVLICGGKFQLVRTWPADEWLA
jgi:hypothetical protein